MLRTGRMSSKIGYILLIIYGVLSVILGVVMWHDAFPVVMGSALICLGLAFLIDTVTHLDVKKGD